MLKSMRDITREFFLGKYPFPIRNDRKKPKSLSLKPSLELLDQRIAPAVDAVAQLVGNGMGADQTPWYAIQGGPNGGTQFDVSEAFTGKDVYLGQGVSSLDIVGDEDQGSIYMAFDTASGGSVFNRMRIGDITAATYMQRAYVGMDFNTDGQVDLYTSANGSNTTVEILLPVDHDANPATIDNTSPENTAFAIYSSAAGVANNYAVTLVSASSDPQPGGTDIGSKADGNPDQFVSWKVALTDLDAAWKVVQTSRGIAPGSQTSLNQDSPFRIISFTFGSVTVEDPKLTDINGVTDFDGGSGPGANSDGFPIWDKGASPGPGIPAGLDVYSKSITLSCLVPPEIAPPFSFQMKEETTKFVTDVNITGSNTNPYMNFSISGTDAGDFSIDANSGVLTFKTLPDFEAPVDSNGDNIYSVSVTITNCVGSDTKLFTVEILDAGEFAPVAVDDSASTNEDVAITISALANDTDADVGQTATLVVGAYDSKTTKGGSVSLSPDGKIFNYTPALNFNGTDTFTYQAMDVDGKLSNLATVTITVSAVNDAPIAVDDSYSTNEDVVLTIAGPGVLGNDSDVDMDPLSAMLVSGPTNGVLVLNTDGSFTYTPNADFNGKDSFSYKANDGSLDSNIAKVTITVNAVNDAPIAVDDSYSTNEDVVLTIAGPGVLGNDSDVDMDPLSAMLVSGPMHGTVTLNPDGSFNYTPALDFNGVDSFSYKANDGSLDSNIAMVTITVDAVNDPPIIDGGESIDVSIPENTTFVTTVLASDVDMDPISYSISGGADGALFQIDPVTGVLSFIAAPDFETPLDMGADNIYDVQVMASDGMGGSATQSVHVTVLDVAEEGPPLVVVPIDFAENSTAPVVDLDAAGTGLTFAIVGGADASFFEIDPMTGVVSFKAPPDFEMPMDAGADNSYDLIVQATTLYGSDLQGLQVHVLDVPEIDDGGEPIVINYPENAVSPVVDVNVVGDNTGLTYSLSGPDAALFSIDADGVVSFLAPPDYEDPLDEGADNTYNITVHVSNSGGYSDSQDVVVNVLDLDEKVEAGPIQVIPDTGTYPDDNLTKAGNPLITFPGEEGLMFTLYGPDGTALIENEHYAVSYFEGDYSITLLDAYPGHDPVPDPDVDPFGTYLPDGTPSGNPDSTADGLYRLVAEDPSGNVAEVGTFEIDTTAPITGPIAIDPDTDPVGDLTTAAGNPEITFAGESGLTTFVVSFADPVTTLGVPLVEGSHYLLSSAEDTADIDGNPLTTTLYTITLLDANLAVPGDQPFGDYFEGIATGNPAFTGDGLYTVEASDIAGNTKAVGSFEIDTESAPPPVVDTIKYLATGNVPQGDVIGPSSVGTTVNIRNAISNDPFGAVTPFLGFDGEVRVAWADFNNDGFKDMVAGAGPGGGPHIKVIDAITGRELLSFFAFDPSFRGGVYVSADDVNSDGLADLVIGAGQGGGPHVRIFDGRTTNEIYSFFAYDVNFTGGVTVATYDYDKDGTLDIVTGAGPGGGPHVKVFDGVSREVIKQIMAYAPDFRGGVYVAAADFNGNLVPDIITGAGPGGGPHVKIINFETLQVVDEEMVFTNYTEPNGQVIDTLFGGGVRVALADGNGDGLLDLLCGAGPGGGPHVKIYAAGSKIREIASYFSGSPDDTSGVFVGG